MVTFFLETVKILYFVGAPFEFSGQGAIQTRYATGYKDFDM